MTKTPFFVIAIVKATIVNAANNWMERQGYGENNFNIPLIRDVDPDSQAARFWAAEFQAEPSLRTIIHRKIDSLGATDAFLFWSKNRKTARQKAKEFVANKGYRIKPSTQA